MPTNGPHARFSSIPRRTPPLAPDITTLETGLLTDPSTALVTALAQSAAASRDNDASRFAMLPTSLLPPLPPVPPLAPPPTRLPRRAGTARAINTPVPAPQQPDLSAVQAIILHHRQEAAQLRQRADELQAVLQHEAHQTQTLSTRYETLRRQATLSPHDHNDLNLLAVLLRERSAQLVQWRTSVQHCLKQARAHDEAAASLARPR